MSDDSSEPWDGKVTTEALRAWARRVPDSADGTERLCLAVYGRPAQPRDFLGGSNAHMLHDAADALAHARFMAAGWRRLARELRADRDRARRDAHKWERRQRKTYDRVNEEALRAAAAEAERDALRERVRVLEAAVDAAVSASNDAEREITRVFLAETDAREPDDGKVTVSLAGAVELVRSLPGPAPEVKRISEWNRLCREQKRGGDR